jgi:hypothetical protein
MRAVALLSLVTLLAQSPLSAQSAHGGHAKAAPAPTAADLRVSLNHLLAEHVDLAAAATGAALGGRQGEFTAAAAALDGNSIALSQAIGMVYGKDAETAFLPLWRRHIGFFVDYTTATARKDARGQQKAVEDLVGYATTFAAFLNSANPNLPIPVVADLVKAHVVGLKGVVDAQAAGDFPQAYTRLREASAHMQMVADPLAQAIARQFPDRFVS